MNFKMKIPAKKHFIHIIVFFAVTATTCAISPDVFGDYATGGRSGGGTSTNTDTHYVCTSARHCPRWIRVPRSVYEDLINRSYVVGSYSEFPACKNDRHVIIAGNIGYNSQHLQIYNLQAPNNVSEAHRKAHSDHVYASKADSNGNVWVENFFDEPNSSNVRGGDDNHVLTWWEVLSEIMQESGETEEDIAVFCPSMIEPPITYYSQSNVSADEYDTTKIQNDGRKAQVTIETEVDDPIPIIFSHNVFASAAATNVYWQVQRTVSFTSNGTNKSGVGHYLGNGNYYDIIQENVGIYQDYTDISQAINYGEGKANFVANRRNYSSGSDSFVARDVYKVKFKKQGTYTFCEAMYVVTVNQKSTEACATIKVGPKSSYLSKSNASNGGSNYVTTGIQSSPKTATVEVAPLGRTGGKVPMVFSHNIYSTVPASNVSYSIKRTVDGSDGFGSFKITMPATAYYSSNSTSSSTGGTANFNTKSEGYYIGEQRKYHDTGSNLFILRDNYEVTFSSFDYGTHLFCETVFVNDEELTSSCIQVVVGGGTPPPPSDPAPTPCSAWVPSSYTNSNSNEGYTSVTALVQNPDARADSWTKTVYAKPYDTTKWLHCYFPGVQYVADTIATKTHKSHSGSDNTNVNQKMSSWGNWGNSYKITQTEFVDDLGRGLETVRNAFPFNNGDTSIRSWDDSYKIPSGSGSRAGKTLTETNTSSAPKEAKVSSPTNCPGWDCHCHQVCETSCGESGCSTSCHRECDTCYHTNEYIANSRVPQPATDTAQVQVPYNYENTASVQIDTSESDVVYAGETVKIDSATFTVSPIQNDTTNGNYATKVKDAKIRLIAYVSNSNAGSATSSGRSGDCSDISAQKDQCAIIAKRTRNLNDPEDTHGATDHDFNSTYNVFDAPAGKYFCVAAAVFPARSNDGTNGISMDTSGNGKWYISIPSCVKIAKRPSMQVWGGNLYVANKLGTTPSTKRVVAGFYDFDDQSNYISGQATSTKNTTVFGSWVEESIVRGNYNEKFDGLASGAATAKYTSDPVNFGGAGNPSNKSPLGGSYEGSANPSLSSYGMPLTFPNTGVTTSSNIAAPTDKSSLLTHFNTETSTNYEYVTDASIGDRNTDPVANPVVLPIGQTKVINSSADTFHIYSDLTYEDGYSTLIEIPKLIIHANNIEIACGVRHIDAILIAENNINTCNGDINSKANSTPLKIFGSVITDVLTLNRTYGSATGANSTVPAEVIDYDTSLYLWGAPRADSASSGSLDITYQRELSPRY